MLRARIQHDLHRTRRGKALDDVFAGVARGDIANDLTALVADPNVTIHEAKAFTCDLRAGRRLARG